MMRIAARVDSQIDLQVSRRLENLGMSEMIAPDPLMSTMMDGCIEKRAVI